MRTHLTDDDLIRMLYGVEPQSGHLAECEGCRARWDRLAVRRKELLESRPEVPVDLLARQREAIRDRVLGRSRSGFPSRLAPALAAVGVVVLALVLSRPVPEPQPTRAANDGGLYTEIYSLVESPEPMAAEPIYGLFDNNLR